ncbi:MAG: hypothetical protein CML06_06865 [Pseudomonadales bacterium]|nr:hypothetical protein [Pseudomonadales bacterium]
MYTDNLSSKPAAGAASQRPFASASPNNQVLGAGGPSQPFDQLLFKQVQDRTSDSAARGANSEPHGGNSLPEQRAAQRREADLQAERRQEATRERQDLARDQRQAARAADERASDQAEMRQTEARQAEEQRVEEQRAQEHREAQRQGQTEARADEQRATQRNGEQAAAQANAKSDNEADESAARQDQTTTTAASDKPAQKVEGAGESSGQAQVAAEVDPEAAAHATAAKVADGTTAEPDAADTGDKTTDIRIDPELAANAKPQASDAQPQSLQGKLDGELEREAALSDEELAALEEATAQSQPIEGAGFPELTEADALAPAAVGTQPTVTNAGEGANQPAAATARATANGQAAALAAQMGQMQQEAGAKGGDSAKPELPLSELTQAAKDGLAPEAKLDKKADLNLIGDKALARMQSLENPQVTPVQERLAALAKALDKSTREPASRGQATALTEAADNSKASGFHRSLEQMSRPQPGAPRTLGAPLQAPLQSREWAGEMGQRLMMMVSTKLNSAQIQVNPRDLGPIDVKVSLQQDQAHVTFTSHAAPTRDALEQAIPRLREMLEQNGVALGDVDVRQQDARESGQQQQRTGRDSGGGSSADPAAEETQSPTVTRQAVGLVDYYA